MRDNKIIAINKQPKGLFMPDCANAVISMSFYLGEYLAETLADWHSKEPPQITNRLVGTLGYAAIAILGIIETVVRSILSIFALPFIYCLPESQKDFRMMLAAVFPAGAILCAQAVAASFNAIIGSQCFDKKIVFEEQAPKCMNALTENIMKYFEEVTEPRNQTHAQARPHNTP